MSVSVTEGGAPTRLRLTDRVDLAALEARHPSILRPSAWARLRNIAIAAAMLGLFLFGFWWIGFSLDRIGKGLDNLGDFAKLMVPPSYQNEDRLFVYLRALAETVAIAFLGTLLASIIALPLSLLAANNVMTIRVFHFFSRRSLDVIRAVDPLIWALIWVNVVGLGPFAGVLAIMSSDIGSFGKLYSEAIEAADKKPVEGVTSTGGTSLHRIRFGMIPQIVPVMVSQVLYYFESNTRSATIIGVVGAGGIGLHFSERIRALDWDVVAFLIILVLITVAIIDMISVRLRTALIGKTATRL